MRKVVLSTYVSLDGVMEEPKWTVPFRSNEGRQHARAQLFASDALLLGRTTYEEFAKAWPAMTDEDGFADRINQMPKYVASTTLTETEWNASLLSGDIAEEVTKLKQQPGQDILIYGSATLMRSLMLHNLIDEYRIWVYPVIVGSGKPLFTEANAMKTLKLIGTKTLPNSIVILSYEPIEKSATEPTG